MSKTMYWVTDSDGVYAQVEGADQRDLATRLHGWTEAGEPPVDAQVHVVNEHPEIGPGRLPYGALESGAWAGRGWKPGPPPELPAPTEQAASSPEPAKPTKATAPAAGDQKEK
jgi:hypothetical protein